MTEKGRHGITLLLLEAFPGCAATRTPYAASESKNSLIQDLAASFVDSARRFGDQIAITTPSGSWSYQEILHAAKVVCHQLQRDLSFQTGSRVILLLPNSVEYIAAFYGILLAGGVVVPVAPQPERCQFLSLLRSTDATHIVTQSRFVRTLPDELREASVEHLSLNEKVAVEESEQIQSNPDSSAVILFTGGSSGIPKGVMLSHRNLIENSKAIQQYLEIRSDDRPLCVLPFYHAFGNSVLQSHLLAGSHLIIAGNATFPETLIQAILDHRATSFSGVPDLFRFLLERSSLEAVQKSSLRYMAVAGGALPHDLATTLADRIQPARFYVMYGQTEATARLAYVPPERLVELGSGCIGRAIPGVELQIVDEGGEQVAPGEVGQIRASGPNIMLGYWGDSALTKETVRDGVLYTGDLGSKSVEGWIYHHGRLNSLIKIAGYRLHPSDVEDFVTRELPVQQAVLVPFEQPGTGTRLALYVRLRPETSPLTTLEIAARCRKQLPRYMVPDLIHIIDEFPLNDAMKVDRPRLVALATQTAAHRRTAV